MSMFFRHDDTPAPPARRPKLRMRWLEDVSDERASGWIEDKQEDGELALEQWMVVVHPLTGIAYTFCFAREVLL